MKKHLVKYEPVFWYRSAEQTEPDWGELGVVGIYLLFTVSAGQQCLKNCEHTFDCIESY